MKKIFLLILLSFYIFGCKDKTANENVEDVQNDTENATSVGEDKITGNEGMGTLASMTPLSPDQLRNWLPDEINGLMRTGFKIGQMGVMSISSVEATYENESKSKKFKFQLMDGAGEMGSSAIAGARILLSQEFEEETQNRIKRTSSKNGVKAIEEYRKDGSRSSIQFIFKDRYFIDVNGTNMTMDEIWDAVDNLPLGKLE